MKKILALVVVSLFLLGTNGCPLSPAPVPKTGQTICFDEEGVVINCMGTGQDGEYQTGIKSPNPRFTDKGDGTVIDHLTGLIWLKNANCFGERTWQEALDDCNNLSAGWCGLLDVSSVGDWRLPNLRELHSIVDYGKDNPALPPEHPFTNVQPSYYWSSTSHIPYPAGAWAITMEDGYLGNDLKNRSNRYVWPVRGGH